MLDSLSNLIQSIAETGQPSLALLVNVIILAIVMTYILWKFKSEIRGIKWNNLPMWEKRKMIEGILSEAIELAEFLYSNLETLTPESKLKVAGQKRNTALRYARTELRAMGAAKQDVRTLDLRLEQVFATRNPNKIRFGASVAPSVTVK